MTETETIAAIATPPGSGAIGIIRVSGSKAYAISQKLAGKKIVPGQFLFTPFKNQQGGLIDKGVMLYFQAPHSYTGEDVVEFNAHGSYMVLQILLEEILAYGARLARPGEFTERAFLNDKIDLVQAEAVMGLIESRSRKAARSAMRSLSGVFSKKIVTIQQKALNARALLEATLDFPDEEDVGLDISSAKENIEQALALSSELIKNTEAGAILDRNVQAVIIGKPNVGKSSLLNTLAGSDVAIVSSTPGTTRDRVRQSIALDGAELMLIDTAGVRESEDEVEQQGIDRSLQSLERADIVLKVFDHDEDHACLDEFLPQGVKIILVRNKIDTNEPVTECLPKETVCISIKTGAGMDDLVKEIRRVLRLDETDENTLLARQRQIQALRTAESFLQQALKGLQLSIGHELVGEQLRRASQGFNEVLGRTTADDILDTIFSQFCIGK